MKFYTIFHPDTITPELEERFHHETTVGNLSIVSMLGGKWKLVPGVDWGDAVHAGDPLEDETQEEYAARMEPQIAALFEAGLPSGLTVTQNQLRMIKQSEQWKAIETEFEVI